MLEISFQTNIKQHFYITHWDTNDVWEEEMVNMVSFSCDRCTFDVCDESSFWRKSLFWQKRDIVKVDSILSLAPKSIDEKDENTLCAKGK